jgi:hypothetical protein
MTDAIKKADAGYAAFAARMLACLASEEADIAARDAKSTLYSGGNVDSASETVRPSKK